MSGQTLYEYHMSHRSNTTWDDQEYHLGWSYAVPVPHWVVTHRANTTRGGQALYKYHSGWSHTVRIPQWVVTHCTNTTVGGHTLYEYHSGWSHTVRIPQLVVTY